MKKLLMLLIAGSCGLLWAQTNHVATATLEPAQPTEVDSDNAVFDMGDAKTPRQVIYHGNVRVTDPKIKLWCETLTLTLPPGHVSHIVAETNVVMDFVDNGEKYHITSDKAVYNYAVVNQVTNETVTWTGNPVVESKDWNAWGEPLVWDRQAHRFYLTHERMKGSATTNSALKLY